MEPCIITDHASAKLRIAEYFNARQDYNRDNFHGRQVDRVIVLAAPQPGERVLDIATGTGLAAIAAGRLVGPVGEVLGVDISTGMLAQGLSQVTASGLSHVRLFEADAENLAFAPRHFDLILCCNALPYMSDVAGALRHWRGFLKPGGRLAFNCWSDTSFVAARLVRDVAARHGIELLAEKSAIGTPDACRATLEQAGYQLREFVAMDETRSIPLPEVEQAWDNWLKQPLLVPPGAAERLMPLKTEYLNLARQRASDHGLPDASTAYYVLATPGERGA